MTKWLALSLFLILLSCNSGKPEVSRGFYHWKTNFTVSDNQNETLEKLNIKNLFAVYFIFLSFGLPFSASASLKVALSTSPAGLWRHLAVVCAGIAKNLASNFGLGRSLDAKRLFGSNMGC